MRRWRELGIPKLVPVIHQSHSWMNQIIYCIVYIEYYSTLDSYSIRLFYVNIRLYDSFYCLLETTNFFS